MLILLWANQIIKKKKTFSEVPAKLKTGVKNKLIQLGHEDLIEEGE